MLVSIDLATVIVAVVAFVLAFYFVAGRLGNVTTGSGPKYDAFAGGEELPPERGKYHSELFVYAALFVAFEVIGLLLSSSIAARGFLWPLLFTLAGGFSMFVMMLWFVGTGGAELA
jgi:NADH:ubiquinone oxidoreductase subunit 3 (subunit A)